MSVFNFPMLLENINFDVSKYSNREKIEIIEWIILNSDNNIADELPVVKFIHDGVYFRQLFIPEGVVLTGKIHLDDHKCLLIEGDLSVMTDEGIKRIQAPYAFDAKAGLKKIGYAHTDCTFTTIHKTDLTDIDEIENKIFSDGDISWVGELMNNTIGITS